MGALSNKGGEGRETARRLERFAAQSCSRQNRTPDKTTMLRMAQSSAQFTSGCNPVNLNQGFFFFCSRPFSRIIFFIFFYSIQSSNCRQKEFVFYAITTKFEFALTSGYLKSTSNNSAMGISVGLTTHRQLPPRRTSFG